MRHLGTLWNLETCEARLGAECRPRVTPTTEGNRTMVSRASDPLAATASRDVAAQAFTMRLSNLFSDVTADDLGRAVTTALRLLAEYSEIDVSYAVLIDSDRIVDVWEWSRPSTRTSPPEIGATVD